MKSTRAISSQKGWIAPAVVLLLALAFAAGPIVLHFTQKTHNVIASPDQRHPVDQPTVPGEIFASTVIAIMEHELSDGTGWRPNDFPLWGPALWADNNSNRQLGILQAVRESVRVFKDHLTKVSSNEYDENLVNADKMFRNDEFKLMFPSAESRYREGIGHLRAYIDGLKGEPRRSRPLNKRNVEAMRIFQAWTDLLGGAHANLYSDHADWLATDDYFYHAQGMAHAIYNLVLAVRREYAEEIQARPALQELVGEVIAPLEAAAQLKPLIVLDGSRAGLFANHRRNLDAFINEARQKMYSIREELEK
ncbi:MAG TPA: DUF2333 family protein [Terriglobales bacterium]|nr:DUF2333 family protein [Terriglobales bacterium]